MFKINIITLKRKHSHFYHCFHWEVPFWNSATNYEMFVNMNAIPSEWSHWSHYIIPWKFCDVLMSFLNFNTVQLYAGIAHVVYGVIRPTSNLTHWGRDKIDNILQKVFSSQCSRTQIAVFWIKFHSNSWNKIIDVRWQQKVAPHCTTICHEWANQ